MDIPLDFKPSADRARLLDERMRSKLAASLSYLLGELRPHVPSAIPAGKRILARLDKTPVAPLSYAVYGDLITAIDDDDLDEAVRLIEKLDRATSEPLDGLAVRDLADPEMDEDANRYVRYIDSDPAMPLGLTTPRADDAARSRGHITGALRLLEKADPDLAAEIGELLREIVLCQGRQDAPDRTFDGASCFLLWGAVLINAGRSGGELEMVQMLAHESAHNLLFGLCPSEPLLLNDPAERHSSPLRQDPRPLEGIYHATYVSARMHRSAQQLLRSGILSLAQEKTVAADIGFTRKSFSSGMAVLDAHARLTPPGREILEHARDYMQGAP